MNLAVDEFLISVVVSARKIIILRSANFVVAD